MKVMMKGGRKRFYNAWNVLTDYLLFHLLLMSKIVFTSLLIVLETRYNLQTSRHISSREMLGIFCTSWAPVQKFSNIEKDFKGLEQ
ncbi:hypothetical protein Gotur_006928 [Gossypium turneri]